ncbi:antibiotic biosynthesis monooxygenase family protein [Pseudonocardia acaciae]|uniref:antibiotic biosynthesis monooxygenase family protein n=1 Tax=Pseudonocardia acaciae TaxID=551276 RepID=UPI00048E578C|nr:antibiotic biosynthesis monooxygenase family protein [Pseudonocardia acaciae]
MHEPVTLTEVPTDDPVTLINAFSVPVEESDLLLSLWTDNARIMARQPGFIRAVMYRALVDDAELRFVNTAHWSSGMALAAARANPEWRASIRRMGEHPGLHATPRPVVYEVVLDVRPDDPL